MMRKKLTTEEFIEKAIAKHGHLYSYSEVSYVNARTKVCIICPKHGKFYQTPNGHLNGKGCFLCSREKAILPLEQFIERANLIHREKYDYRKVVYKGFGKKVCIICPLHGEFYQDPNNHLKGYGCHSCSKIKLSRPVKFSTDLFIKKSIITHGEKFDYSKVIYKNPRKKVCIICKIHGEFYQEPHKHMKGAGCKKCVVDSQRLSLDDFILKSNKIHGRKYDYSKIKIIKNNKEKVCIICPIHGEFWQKSGEHSTGSGCPTCAHETLARSLALSREEFINKAIEVHKDTYDYSNVNYVNNNTKVRIICKIHGEFYQKPGVHLKTKGCPQCNFSIGEQAIMSWLKKNKINFDPNHTFGDLKGPGEKPLKFDFYIPCVKRLIEFDGPQHFRPVRFNGISIERAIKIFKKNQYNDSLKNQYCMKKSIPLIRIPYQKFKQIPEILNKELLGINNY